MRISRPCYDKPWRCPGWAGGGWKGPKGESRCPSGAIGMWYKSRRFLTLRFGRCSTCGVITLPSIMKKLSPWWWWSEVKFAIGDFFYWRENRKWDKKWNRR